MDAIDKIKVKTDVAILNSSNTALMLLNQIKKSEISVEKGKSYDDVKKDAFDQL